MGNSIFERVEVSAGGRTMSFGIDGSDAVRVTGWDWPVPAQKLVAASGPEGSRRVAGNEWEDRTVTIELESVGHGDGVAEQWIDGQAPRTPHTEIDEIDWATTFAGALPASLDYAATLRNRSTSTIAIRLGIRRASVWLGSTTVSLAPGETRRVSGTASGLTGDGPVYLRAAGSPLGAFSGSRALIGVGGGHLFFDRGTPGARRVGGKVVRPAGGEAWSRAVRQHLGELAGAVACDRSATLTRWTEDGEPVEFRLLSMNVESEESGEGYLGWVKPKLTFQCEPIGTGSRRIVQGSVVSDGAGSEWTGTNVSLPIAGWTGSGIVPGDLPAVGSVSVQWPTPQERMLAVVASGSPTNLVGGAATWTPYPGASWSGQDLSFASPTAGMQPVCWANAPATGRYLVVLACRPFSSVHADAIGLRVGGRLVARVTSWPRTHLSQSIVLGEHDLEAGDRLDLAVQAASSGVSPLVMNGLHLIPAEKVATVAAAARPEALVAGDFPSSTGLALMPGSNGIWGGTWDAPAGWTRSSTNGYYGPSGSGASWVSLASVARPFRAVWEDIRWSTGYSAAIGWNTGTAYGGAVAALDATSYAGSYFRTAALMLTVDAAGMWEVATADVGGWEIRSNGTTTHWATPERVSLWLPNDMGVRPMIRGTHKVWELSAPDATTEWSPTSRALAAGDLPVFEPRQVPRVVLHPGPNNMSVPTPTDVAVELTPRYLTVPGGV